MLCIVTLNTLYARLPGCYYALRMKRGTNFRINSNYGLRAELQLKDVSIVYHSNANLSPISVLFIFTK